MADATRADLELALVSRWNLHLDACGRSTLVGGANPDLDGPLWEGARAAGVAVAGGLVLATPDLVGVPGDALAVLKVVAELRLVEDLLARLPFARLGNVPDDNRAKAREQLASGLERRKADLERLSRDPLLAPPGVSSGVMRGPDRGRDGRSFIPGLATRREAFD